MFHVEQWPGDASGPLGSPMSLLLLLYGLRTAYIIIRKHACLLGWKPYALWMYGKHFASMYEGSMVGAGAVVFAVMGYVIAKQEPDKKVGSQVRLNPVLLSAILGEQVKEIEKAIKYLCSPDERSTTKEKAGRRLVKLGEFDYQVVNGAKYRAVRDEEARREQNRLAQERFRQKAGGGGSFAERLAVKNEKENGPEPEPEQ